MRRPSSVSLKPSISLSGVRTSSLTPSKTFTLSGYAVTSCGVEETRWTRSADRGRDSAVMILVVIVVVMMVTMMMMVILMIAVKMIMVVTMAMMMMTILITMGEIMMMIKVVMKNIITLLIVLLHPDVGGHDRADGGSYDEDICPTNVQEFVKNNKGYSYGSVVLTFRVRHKTVSH